jgi:ligand-binding SRPBCC domain-containing protein
VTRLVVETFIRAPRERVFDLARDVEAHNRSAAFSGERCVEPGRTHGLLELGELVTFEGVHFGIRQRVTAKIVELDFPRRLVDELQQSAFTRLRHEHDFEERDGGTLMRDTLDWTSPLGPLGRLADSLVVYRHMKWFVTTKQLALKAMAEG